MQVICICKLLSRWIKPILGRDPALYLCRTLPEPIADYILSAKSTALMAGYGEVLADVCYRTIYTKVAVCIVKSYFLNMSRDITSSIEQGAVDKC